VKIITFAAIKGGVGKTTLTFNFGEWLSRQNKNVLLIDSDHQCSLTQTYDIYRNNGTLADVFDRRSTTQPEIIRIHKNLSLLPASLNLDVINNDLQTRTNKELLMYLWFSDHYKTMFSHFDYVLIDCHPDFSTITQNMIAISDFIFSPIEPSEYGFIAKTNLELRMDQFRKDIQNVQTRESLITAKLLFIGNRIKHNTNSSREFSDAILKDKRTIALVPDRELFNRSTLTHTPLAAFESDTSLSESNRKLLSEVDQIFHTFIASTE
jgi:chromosome partitioning protein